MRSSEFWEGVGCRERGTQKGGEYLQFCLVLSSHNQLDLLEGQKTKCPGSRGFRILIWVKGVAGPCPP